MRSGPAEIFCQARGGVAAISASARRSPSGVVRLLIQRLGNGPGRVHLDIHTDNLAAELTRLESLGAERVQQVHSWWVLRDPAGMLFCVVPEDPGVLNDSNAQRWD